MQVDDGDAPVDRHGMPSSLLMEPSGERSIGEYAAGAVFGRAFPEDPPREVDAPEAEQVTIGFATVHSPG